MQFIHPCSPVFELSEGLFRNQSIWHGHLLYDSANAARMMSQDIKITPEKYAAYNFSLFCGANVQVSLKETVGACDKIKN